MQRDLLDSRAPSPWDKFSVSPSPRTKGLEIEMRRSDGVPKLTPEVEQGNVEYKLILMNPSPERLQKLVTQMNWRLMEGGGQAYYQLGVADSGELVGLTRYEMEATLETLESMAGELGASVLINREIEVRGRLSALPLDSVKGMNPRRDRSTSSTPLSTSVTSTDVSTTDTEASELEGTDEQDDNTTDSPSATSGPSFGSGDPDEIIVRSAPVPITHSFLRRRDQQNLAKKQRERTLRPIDFSPGNIDPSDEGDADDEDPQFGTFDLTKLGSNLPSSSVELDPDLPPKSKSSKPVKPPKGSKRPKGSKPQAESVPPKTPEQIAQKLADKRAKRDRRREERKRALMDPIYDHSALTIPASGEHGIEYDKIVSQVDEDQESATTDGALHSPEAASRLTSSLATLRREEVTAASHEGYTLTPEKPDYDEGILSVTTDEPRLIVEALVVRKAGFGRGFVDLSQFDEELRHLPSFSLS
ncbi:hypothetical protein FRC14_001571 [Serendipita sp. 396]|nr:hypothetical protein FRC14_001571 [Serendipita sp. 396]KAG8785185.1 hypothetical protein FRC15_001842 [Serendipita sp. 397]